MSADKLIEQYRLTSRLSFVFCTVFSPIENHSKIKMKRSFPSGAQKRKSIKEQRGREDENLTKYPKINNIFSVVPSSSSSVVDSNVTTPEPPIEHVSVGVIENESDLDIADKSDVEEMSDSDSNIVNMRLPSDAALWNIDTEILSLQSYWTGKGIHITVFPAIVRRNETLLINIHRSK